MIGLFHEFLWPPQVRMINSRRVNSDMDIYHSLD